MNIFDFITQDELDELPEDSSLAFTNFVRIAQRRLAEQCRALNPDDESNWHLIEDARHGFMNVVIAAAKRYEIEPFATLNVPRLEEFDSRVHRQFSADLDHYMTQLLLDNSIRGRRDTVFLEPNAKDRIRAHIHGLKTCVDNSDLPKKKKLALLEILAEFETELENRRASFLKIMMVALEILAVPGGVWASAEIANKLVTNVLQVVGEAKKVEDAARQLPHVSEPMPLSAPRQEDPIRNDLDDEIPF